MRGRVTGSGDVENGEGDPRIFEVDNGEGKEPGVFFRACMPHIMSMFLHFHMYLVS